MRRQVIAWILAHLLILGVASLVFLIDAPVPAGATALVAALRESRPVTLPEDWHQTAPELTRTRYVLQHTLPVAPESAWALLLPSVRMNAAVIVNGVALAPRGRLEPPVSRLWTQALLFSIPAALLVAGDNRLEIILAAEPRGTGYLAAPLLGPYTALQPVARRLNFLRHTLVQIVVTAMFAISGVMGLIWWLRRAWGVHNLNFVIVDPPFATRLWDALAYFTLGLFLVATTWFIHRYLGVTRPRIERSAAAFVGIVGAGLFVLPEPLLHKVGIYLWNPAVLVLGTYLNLYIAVAAWRQRGAALHVLASSGHVMVLYGAHDALIASGLASWRYGYTLHYAAAYSLVVFSVLLARRFVATLEDAEALNRELDRRVTAKSAELAQQHDEIRRLERQHAVAAERERIARDIHDSVGGQLVGLLARTAGVPLVPGPIQSTVRQVLADLRLIVDALDIGEGDLATAFATFRHRAEGRLRGSGITLHWQPADLPTLPHFGPHEILDVLRMLEEALGNALRHAQATQIALGAVCTDDGIELYVADNGQGFAPDHRQGHGLANLAARAARIGARVSIDARAPGSCVRIVIPTDD